MGKKKKSLAQLPYGSKEWDEEMERQNPGWGVRHGINTVFNDWPISQKRKERLRGPVITPEPLPPIAP
jgi:hypothetical protein